MSHRTPAGHGRVVVIDDQGGFVGLTPSQGPTRHAPVLLDAAKGGERTATAGTVTRTSPPVLFKTPLTDHPEVGRPAV
jgi:hypothetical protein